MVFTKKRKYGMERGARPSRTSALRKRQQGGRNRTVTVPRDKLGFPQSMKATLRYCTAQDFDLNDSNAHQAAFRANDLFDPQHTVGGHQPRSFDQYMELYNTFTVKQSKISVNWVYEGYNGPTAVTAGAYANLVQDVGAGIPLSVPALPAVVCGLHKGTESLTAGTAEQQMEKDRTQWKVMTPQSGSVTSHGTMAISDFFGKDALTGSEGYTGTDSSGPTNEVLWELWAARASNDYVPVAGHCHVRAYISIEYSAMFTDPKTLSAS